MDPVMLRKLAYTAVLVVVINLFFHILKRYARRTQQRLEIRKSRYFAIKRLLSMMSLVVHLVLLIIVWNLNLRSVWVSATGILALIAISFFAVWSLIGNILAGFILYFTSPFKVDDIIEIMPDEVAGAVLAINTFYTVLMDDEKNYINIPNSMFFQRYIRVIKTRKPQPSTDMHQN